MARNNSPLYYLSCYLNVLLPCIPGNTLLPCHLKELLTHHCSGFSCAAWIQRDKKQYSLDNSTDSCTKLFLVPEFSLHPYFKKPLFTAITLKRSMPCHWGDAKDFWNSGGVSSKVRATIFLMVANVQDLKWSLFQSFRQRLSIVFQMPPHCNGE